ncbi:UNVERIFIED_CONTAM: hypothetical protein Sradi_3270200 [Sesamum radiatum]|uniref:Reverse transcriptase zinc-binding domain-containing protein n=1 Tax=Sesamum radiatum TaxID=300843 RepID=A0AAW2R051_SESRA
MMRNAFPTACNLRQRQVPNVEVGPTCRWKEEDARHMMVLCDVARQVWVMANTLWSVVGVGRVMGEWFQWLFKEQEHFALGAIIAWAL